VTDLEREIAEKLLLAIGFEQEPGGTWMLDGGGNDDFWMTINLRDVFD
jgi:hypothetical protein